MTSLSVLQPQSLYPRNDNLTQTVQLLSSQLPITKVNELKAALALYHNTLLFEQMQTQVK